MSYLGKLYGKTVIDNSDSDELAKDYKVELELDDLKKTQVIWNIKSLVFFWNTRMWKSGRKVLQKLKKCSMIL